MEPERRQLAQGCIKGVGGPAVLPRCPAESGWDWRLPVPEPQGLCCVRSGWTQAPGVSVSVVPRCQFSRWKGGRPEASFLCILETFGSPTRARGKGRRKTGGPPGKSRREGRPQRLLPPGTADCPSRNLVLGRRHVLRPGASRFFCLRLPAQARGRANETV